MFNNNQINTKRQVNTWVIALRESPIKRNPNQTGYTAESPYSYWPRGVLASTHTNELMIIAKGETHTHNNQTGKRVS